MNVLKNVNIIGIHIQVQIIEHVLIITIVMNIMALKILIIYN